MSIDVLLKEKALGENPNRPLEAFLDSMIPFFKAPVNAMAWKREIPKLQHEALKKVYLRGIPERVIKAKPRVVWGEVINPDPCYRIRKLRFEAYPRYWIPALIYEPVRVEGRVPVVLCPNGHNRGGKAEEPKQIRCVNLVRRGMIAMSIEFIGMSELEADCEHNTVAHLNLTGMAGVGLFYLALQKALDVLLARPHADPRRVCVTGLSGGGWQTIVISSLDPRVTVSIPVAGYTTIRGRIRCPADMGDQEQMPVDLTTVLDFNTMTAMLAPRPALLILNDKDDCCFVTNRTRPLIYDAVCPTYAAMGALDKFQTYNNFVPGTHNYGPDNRSQCYRFLNRHFGLSTPEQDIHKPTDVLTEDRLWVGLPPDQRTMMGLALERANRLCHSHGVPATAGQRKALRAKLAEVIRLPRYTAKATASQQTDDGSLTAVRVGPWRVPLTVQNGKHGEPPVVIVNDAGRSVPPPLPVEPAGSRYFADILGVGECVSTAIQLSMIDTVGRRYLGEQVAQVLALARMAARKAKTRKVHMIGTGWNTCFVMLVAAAIEPGLFASYTDYNPVKTLRYIMDWPMKFDEAQSFLCFGLLEVADTPQIRELMEGVVYRNPGRAVPPDTR